MSWFHGKDSKAKSGAAHPGAHQENFWPVTSYNSGFGRLTDKDTEWSCISNNGFQTETQTWYSVLTDGSILMVQVIWSYLGVFLIPATAQMTFKIYNPTTKTTTWKSVNVSNFKHDGRNCKSDSFEIKHSGSASGEEAYHITANLDKNVQIDMVWTRPASAPGCKYGTGEDGGFSIFGKEKAEEKRDAIVVHRFHPIVVSSGQIVVDGKAIDVTGNAMFVHAIQGGMRPNLIAANWNFAFFTTGGGEPDSELGSVRAIQMEFETTDDYGPAGKGSGHVKVNIGVIYASNLAAPLLVVGQTHTPEPTSVYPVPNQDISTATHLNTYKDDTGYMAPKGLAFVFGGVREDTKAPAKAELVIDDVTKGFIEKVDVLSEIPYVIRKGYAAISGTKPFIFQYHNAATLQLDLGDKNVPVRGWAYTEASFVSQ